VRSELALIAALSIGCVPAFDADQSVIDRERVIAVRSTPAEQREGESVHLEALVIGPDGVRDTSALRWDLCRARRAITDGSELPSACFEASQDLVPIGDGLAVDASLPNDACRYFGPDPPPAMAGQAPGRPADPDSTGGYAQPLRLALNDELSVATVRLQCGLAGATQEQSALFTRRYHANTAPELTIAIDGVTVGDSIEVDGSIEIEARWAPCPIGDACGDGACGPTEDTRSCAGDCETIHACGGAEEYLRFDPIARELVVEREPVRIAWLTTTGHFAVARTGVAADDPGTSTHNTLFPDGNGVIAIVARDGRGAVTWHTIQVISR
jgi:hypothetical protein